MLVTSATKLNLLTYLTKQFSMRPSLLTSVNGFVWFVWKRKLIPLRTL